VKRFGEWRLNWEPGTRYEYHATSAHWVLAEIIDRVTGSDFCDELERRVTGPIGLPRVLGIAEDKQSDVAMLEPVGELATADEIKATFGISELPVTEVTEDALLGFNNPKVKALGVPGGGGLMRAADLALFYQALLHNPGGVWKPDVLADVTTNVRNRLPDPLTNTPREPQPQHRSSPVTTASAQTTSAATGPHRPRPARSDTTAAGGQPGRGDPATELSLWLLHELERLDKNVVARRPRSRHRPHPASPPICCT
jgi:CubicO group peptidase (beta-lactamase class C family)